MALGEASTKFASVLKQSLLSLSVNIGGLAAGLIITSNLEVVRRSPWTIMAYPAILSMRGTIGGVFSGHFSTGLHLGNMRPRFLGNTDEYYDLIASLLTLNVIASAFLWMIAAIVLSTMGEQPLPLLVTLIGTTGLGALTVTPISTKVISIGYRKGIDPDILSYPVESTLADIVVTACYVLLLWTETALGHVGWLVIGAFDILYLMLVIALSVQRRERPGFVSIVKESVLVLVISSILVNITGILLVSVSSAIEKVRLIYMVYPAIIDTVGDVGSIVGSMVTTRLALGELKATFGNMTRMLPELGGSWLASAVMFQIYGLASWVFFGGLGIATLARLSLVLFTTNVIAALAIAIVSLTTAILTYTRGFNPDNFVIPIESSLADSLTTSALLLSIVALGLE